MLCATFSCGHEHRVLTQTMRSWIQRLRILFLVVCALLIATKAHPTRRVVTYPEHIRGFTYPTWPAWNTSGSPTRSFWLGKMMSGLLCLVSCLRDPEEWQQLDRQEISIFNFSIYFWVSSKNWLQAQELKVKKSVYCSDSIAHKLKHWSGQETLVNTNHFVDRNMINVSLILHTTVNTKCTCSMWL